MHKSLGAKLNFSIVFHPEIDGQSERTIQILEDMLRVYILNMQGLWDEHISLIEFVYNNNYQASIRIAPYEVLYGRRYRSSIHWDDISKRRLLGPKLVQQIVKNIQLIKERL